MSLPLLDILFTPLCTMKWQALANFLVSHLVPVNSPLNVEFPNEKIFNFEVIESSILELFLDGATSC